MFVSILGDSLSTFEGYQPEGYAVFYDREKQALNGITSVYDMWWAKVNQALHAYLCVNNAYSGSKVAGLQFPSGNTMDRIRHLRTKKLSPDLILVYLGTNDFGYGIPLYDKTATMLHRHTAFAFQPAYEIMLERIHRCYPKAIIACSTLQRTTKKNDSEWKFPERLCGTELEAYNEIIRTVVAKKGCILADICSLDRPYETVDGFHATAKGHLTIAQNWLVFLGKAGLIQGNFRC